MARSPDPIQIVSELVASVAEVSVAVGDEVPAGGIVALLESMKMEIPLLTERAGRVTDVRVSAGDVVQDGDILVVIQPTD
ncbi:MAG: biotin/lipoyl-binding carrier protein [Marmoricola sp.]